MLWMAALTTLVASGIAMGFPVLHCWAEEVVAFALAKLQALAYLPRATCPDRRAGELLVGTPLCGVSRGHPHVSAPCTTRRFLEST